MNKKKLSLNFVIGLILLLSVLQLSFAASVIDITKGTEQAMLCPRETGLFTDVVKNADNKAREFTITTKGSAAGWATAVPNGFVLLPGESKTIYAYITPVQDSIPASYELIVSVSSQGLSEEIAHKAVVKKCYGSSLEGDSVVKRSCPNEVVKYEMSLRNNGEYKESFILEADGQIKDRVTLSDKAVVLEKGETKKVIAYAKAPNQDGSYAFNVKSTGQIGRTLEGFNAVLNVDPCYAFVVNIKGNNSYSICERTLLTIPVQVENKGTVQNLYDVNVEGPEWAKLDKNQFILYAGEKEFITLAVAPTYGVEGDYKVKFSVVPQKGDLKASSEFSFNVRKCHSVKAMFLQQNVTVCNGLSENFDAIITNDGEFKKQYAVDVEAPVWVFSDIPESRLFSLNPGQQQKFRFTARPGEDVNESLYPVTLKVTAVDDSKISVFADAQSFVSNLLPSRCYRPSISTQFEELVVYYDSAVTLPLSIKNEGLSKVTYDIVLSGTASNFVKLTPSVLAVETGKAETSYLYVAPTPNLAIGSYDAIISLKLKDGSFLITRKIPITVTNDKSKATSLGIASNELPTLTLQEEKKPTRWQRFKEWLKRNFGVDKKEQADETAQLEKELEEASAEVNALEENKELVLEEQTNKSEDVVVVEDSAIKDKIKAYRYYILAGIIVLLAIIILIRVDAFKKAKDFFEDEEE